MKSTITRTLLASLLLLAPCALAAKTAKPADTTSDGQHSGGPKGWGSYRITDDKAEPALPRVLLTGDSVANGYHTKVAKLLKGKANVDLFITPAHVGVPEYREKLAKTLTYGTYAVIHFNESGLHAWIPGRVPEGQYGPCFAKAVATLRAGAPKARLIWASNTPVTIAKKPEIDQEVSKIVLDMNAAARPIAEKEGMAIDDLYALMIDKPAMGAGDRWHWNSKGQAVQAAAVAASILAELKKADDAAAEKPAAKPAPAPAQEKKPTP